MDNRTRREIQARNAHVRYESERVKAAMEGASGIRHEISLLAPEGCVGCELGVDTGQFTKRLWDTGRFSSFHAVDKWDDRAHSRNQYLGVCKALIDTGVKVWRMTAQEFLGLHNTGERPYGFMYIDCYAHTGQDDGGFLDKAYNLIMPGGILAGDDYDQKHWPLTYKAVNEFAGRLGCEVSVFDKHLREGDTELLRMDRHPSWWIRRWD